LPRPFQTNPRGVEAVFEFDETPTRKGFRRTLVGLKLGSGVAGALRRAVSDEPSWG